MQISGGKTQSVAGLLSNHPAWVKGAAASLSGIECTMKTSSRPPTVIRRAPLTVTRAGKMLLLHRQPRGEPPVATIRRRTAK